MMLLPTFATRAFGLAVRNVGDNMPATDRSKHGGLRPVLIDVESGKGSQVPMTFYLTVLGLNRKEPGPGGVRQLSLRLRHEEVPPWGVGASARGIDRIARGRSTLSSRTRAPGSEDGHEANPMGSLTNAMLNKSTAVARLNQGRGTSRARGISRGSVHAIWQEGALGAVAMAWRSTRRRKWPTMRKAFFKLTVHKIARVKCGLPCKMHWRATSSNIAKGS